MTSIPRLICSLASCLVLAACGRSDLVGLSAQGIIGQLLIGPTCPVQTVEDPCPDVPYQAWIDVYTPSGKSVAGLRTDADGTFTLGLLPGTYLMQPRAVYARTTGWAPMAPEQTVEVERGSFTSVLITFDSGIR